MAAAKDSVERRLARYDLSSHLSRDRVGESVLAQAMVRWDGLDEAGRTALDGIVRAAGIYLRSVFGASAYAVRQKAGLNKAILDQGWGEFGRQLGYKQGWRGGWLLEVPAANTSRRCPECDHVDAANRPSQAVFRCVSCGYEANADDVASVNIARAGHARLACGHTSLVSASAQEPTEAGLAFAA